MILICTDVNEPSTDIVCSWLKFYKKKFLRISCENIITIKNVYIDDNGSDVEFSIDGETYLMSQFESYWYRRSYLNFGKVEQPNFIFESIDLTEEYKSFLKDEYNKLIDFFQLKLSKISKLNNFNDNNINKLITLNTAQELGIKIPRTIISKKFKNSDIKNENWITKPISDLIMFKGDFNYSSTTKRVDESDFEEIELSLIQSEIDKKFEIRSFYFNKEFYSSVIFSQENSKTELDFRNYDTENPNRVVPFTLPQELEKKLITLSEKMNLNSGSFDIAYTNNGQYVLFEINPVGQFEQVSFPCNFDIHKKIAEFL